MGAPQGGPGGTACAVKAATATPVPAPGPAGAPGAQGPKGDTGATGDPGAKGDPGIKGDAGATGTANVITSDWFYAPASTDSTYDNSAIKETVVNVPAFTANAIAQNDIHVYMTFGSGVLPLPYSSYAGAKASTISFRVATGKLYITRWTQDNSDSVSLNSLLQYRYVLIPRGTLGAPPG